MMPIGVLLLFVSLFTVFLSSVSSQGCDQITQSDLQGREGLVADTFISIDSPEPPNVEVFWSKTVCLAPSSTRYRYSFASVIVNYRCEEVSMGCDGNSTSQFDFQCSDSLSEPSWVASVFGNSSYVRSSPADVSTELRIDCAVCINPDQADAIGVTGLDPDTHCASCHPTCRSSGQGLCYGLEINQCCSYYDPGGLCVDTCGANQQPASDGSFECVCLEGRTGPNCEENVTSDDFLLPLMWMLVILSAVGVLVICIFCFGCVIAVVNCRMMKKRGHYSVSSGSSVSLDEIDKPETVETTEFQVPGPLDRIDFDHLRMRSLNLMPAGIQPSNFATAPNHDHPITESLPLAEGGTPMSMDFNVPVPLAGSTPARPMFVMPIPLGGSLPRSIPMRMTGAAMWSPDREHYFDITQSLPGRHYHIQHSVNGGIDMPTSGEESQ